MNYLVTNTSGRASFKNLICALGINPCFFQKETADIETSHNRAVLAVPPNDSIILFMSMSLC
jgi:hypothetical protein